MENNVSKRKLVSFKRWLDELGVTATTGWRWRKRGVLHTTNIYGRLYISEEAIADFVQRAEAGEFAISVNPNKGVSRN
ncbi:MAG: hypothetical protein WCT12_09915 [Verrucomicrobiota bacterium]